MNLWVRTQQRDRFVKVDDLWIEESLDERVLCEASKTHQSIMEHSYNFGSTAKAEAEYERRLKEIYKNGKRIYSLKCKDGTLGVFGTKEQPMAMLDLLQNNFSEGYVNQILEVEQDDSQFDLKGQ